MPDQFIAQPGGAQLLVDATQLRRQHRLRGRRRAESRNRLLQLVQLCEDLIAVCLSRIPRGQAPRRRPSPHARCPRASGS